jgi:hypothetical protein
MSQLWNELHTRALNFTGKDDSIFIRNWGNRIPRFKKGCKCKEFWTIWSRNNPPTYYPADAYFAWTVKAHNAVNTKLGKKTFTVEEARKLYDTTLKAPLSYTTKKII